MKGPTVKRWTKISLRTLHLVSVAGVGGGILFGLDKAVWVNYWWLALTSGVLLMAIDIVSNPVWLVQVRGLAIYLKLVLLGMMGVCPQWAGIDTAGCHRFIRRHFSCARQPQVLFHLPQERSFHLRMIQRVSA